MDDTIVDWQNGIFKFVLLPLGFGSPINIPGSRNIASDLVNEPATSSRAVNEVGGTKPRIRKSTGRKNIVDERKNIMDNRNASTEQSISNNYKEGEMADDEKNTKDNKEKQVSVSPAEPKESEEDQPDSPQSSVSDDERSSSSSSFVNVPESNGSVNVLSSTGSGSSFEEVGEDENISTPKSSSPQDIQPGISTSKPSGTGAEGSATVSSAKGDKKKQTPIQPAKDTAQIDDDDGYDLSWLFLEEGNQIPHPESKPIPSLTSKKPEQVSNAAPQNTKSSNLHIAASALAAVGVILGVAIAVHLEMLVVGILVGVCCLVAAAVMYHYEWPSSFIENNKVEKVVPNEKKEPVDTSV